MYFLYSAVTNAAIHLHDDRLLHFVADDSPTTSGASEAVAGIGLSFSRLRSDGAQLSCCAALSCCSCHLHLLRLLSGPASRGLKSLQPSDILAKAPERGGISQLTLIFFIFVSEKLASDSRSLVASSSRQILQFFKTFVATILPLKPLRRSWLRGGSLLRKLCLTRQPQRSLWRVLRTPC